MATIKKTIDTVKSPKKKESIHGDSDDDIGISGITPQISNETQKMSDNKPLI